MARYLGEFEHTVLVALLRCDRSASGREIHSEILQTTGRDASVPAVYVTLKRMTEKGYVATTAGRPIADSIGRGTKTFLLTADGARALLRTRDLFDRLWSGVDPRSLQGI